MATVLFIQQIWWKPTLIKIIWFDLIWMFIVVFVQQTGMATDVIVQQIL